MALFSIRTLIRAFLLLLAVHVATHTVHAQNDDSAEADAATAAEPKENSEAGEAGTAVEEPPKPEVVIPPPFTLRPYEVLVHVSWPVDAHYPQERRHELSDSVSRDLTSRFRQMWNMECREALTAERQTASALQQANAEEWTAKYIEQGYDKVLHVVVEQNGVVQKVTAVEWCLSSQTLSPLVQLESRDSRELAKLVADAASRAFRPIGEIEVSEGEKLEFRIRAGEFPPEDPALAPFQVGQYLIPYVRYFGKKREIQSVRTIPWTYLKVVERDRSRVRVETKSAFGQPVPKAGRRMEVMVMLLRPSWDASEVLLYPRGSRRTPLVGYHCDVVDRLPTKEDPVPERDVYYSTREGTIRIPVPEKGDPLRYLMVHSGQSVLAQLPILPGTAPWLEVEVPDDRARLTVEGEVSLLQGELIDIIATREVVFARTRAAAKKEDWTSYDKFNRQIDELPKLEEFKGRIETLQLKAVYQAQQAKDRVAEIRIKRLCGKVLESAETHLDPGRIAEFRGEMRGVRPE
ncbi:MAG: hypothetical protein H6824_13120 [Planctomycetaceae bacterium]|nr:hypothetical protein [Planctomycetaceae bacterium]